MFPKFRDNACVDRNDRARRLHRSNCLTFGHALGGRRIMRGDAQSLPSNTLQRTEARVLEVVGNRTADCGPYLDESIAEKD